MLDLRRHLKLRPQPNAVSNSRSGHCRNLFGFGPPLALCHCVRPTQPHRRLQQRRESIESGIAWLAAATCTDGRPDFEEAAYAQNKLQALVYLIRNDRVRFPWRGTRLCFVLLNGDTFETRLDTRRRRVLSARATRALSKDVELPPLMLAGSTAADNLIRAVIQTERLGEQNDSPERPAQKP